MLKRGPRVFHVNSEDDKEKLDGWLRRGPRYTIVERAENSYRRILLYDGSDNFAEAPLIGAIICMSESYAEEEILSLAKKWAAS